MKKFLVSLLLLGLSLGMAAAAYAATPSAAVYIHVTVVSGTVSISRTSAQDVALSQVVVASTTCVAYSTFTNDGDTRSNWYMSATTTAWILQTSAPGTAFTLPNQVRLSAIWAATTTPPLGLSGQPLVAGDWTALDTMTTTSVICDATHYARPGDGPAVKAYNVDPAQIRYVYFRFDTPLGTSYGLAINQDLTVTVTAASAL